MSRASLCLHPKFIINSTGGSMTCCLNCSINAKPRLYTDNIPREGNQLLENELECSAPLPPHILYSPLHRLRGVW